MGDRTPSAGTPMIMTMGADERKAMIKDTPMKQAWRLLMTFLVALFFTMPTDSLAANYLLEIIQPQEGLSTNGCVGGTLPCNRFYRAYPGLEYNVRMGVIGGDYPYVYSLITAPSGMTIDAGTGEII